VVYRLRSDWLTEAVAPFVDAQGKFVFPTPALAPGEIAEDSARTLAVGFAQILGGGDGNWKPNLERDHGGPIDWFRLAPCDRAYYALPAYGPPPPWVPGYVSRPAAPFWVVPLCNTRDEPEVTVSVSTLATNLTLVDGKLRFPQFTGGGEFAIYAVLPGWARGRGVWIRPERAVELVTSGTGARVAAVPTFVQRGRADGQLFFPDISRWRLELDRPLTVRSVVTRAQYDTRELWVGMAPGGEQLLVPRAAQPDSVLWLYPAADSAGNPVDPTRYDSVRLKVRVPVNFDTVTIVRGS